jgi:hypothetical protein
MEFVVIYFCLLDEGQWSVSQLDEGRVHIIRGKKRHRRMAAAFQGILEREPIGRPYIYVHLD